jgi:tetratricopeptide (TPR) repeat protein
MNNFDKLWNFNEPKSTEEKFRELLPVAEKSWSKAEYLQLLTQIARSLGLQRKFNEAHQTLDIVNEELFKTDNLNDNKLTYVRYLLERGRVYNSSGKQEDSKKYFLEAYQLSSDNCLDFYAVDAAHMMGIVTQGGESLKWSEIAIDICEKSQDEQTKKWVGALYNNTGWTYFDMKNYEKALDLFKRGLKFREEMKQETETRIAKWCIAKTKRMMGNVQESLEMQRSILKEIEQKKAEHDGYVFEEIGECLLAQSKKPESKEYFKKAYEILSKDEWMMENEKDRMDRMKELGI